MFSTLFSVGFCAALIHVTCFLIKVFSVESIHNGQVSFWIHLVSTIESLCGLAWFIVTIILVFSFKSVLFSIFGLLIFAFYAITIYRSTKLPHPSSDDGDFHPTLRDKLVVTSWGFLAALFLLLPYLIYLIL